MSTKFGTYTFGGFGVEVGNNQNYPPGLQIKFGSNFAHSDYVIPMARFQFLNPDGSDASAPIIYVRMGSAFNTQVINSWTDATNVFAPGGNVPGQSEAGLFGLLSDIAGTGMDAIQRQILSGITEAAGYIGSAGLAGKQQVEFIRKKFLNNFQQLIYSGTTFRRFQLPFSMKPTSYEEAQAMWDIISTFRVASGPKAIPSSEVNLPGSTFDLETSDRTPENLFVDGDVNKGLTPAGEEFQRQSTVRSGAELGRSADVLTFGYPDLTQFDLILARADSEIDYLFRSEACVIESVSVDYGAGSKMKFFDAQGDGNYYPTDVNLTISLREIRLPTAGQMGLEYQRSQVIL
jgi:hypothetical protein